jgi:hypothetical protein
MRILVSLVFTSFVFFSASSPDRPENVLLWDENKVLTWRDFLGKPDPLAKGDAASKVSIRATPLKRGKQLHYDVNTVFHRNDSWCKTPSAELLKHEQVHFDIAELYARKARKKISSLKREGVRDVKVYNAAISRIFDESNLTDAEYDRETVHGASRKKQTEWEYSIRIELMLLNRFSKHNWDH